MKGYEKIWIIGDEFANNTVHQFFKGKKSTDGTYDSYTFAQYEVRTFTTDRNCHDRNILSRIRNSMANALNEHTGLPKIVVFVIDDDIITSIPGYRQDSEKITRDYEYVINSLMTMLDTVVEIYKDYLPQKSKRENIPHMLWMAPPSHRFFTESNNEKRGRFTSALATAVTLHENTSMLKLVKFWDSNNTNLFLEEQYRYTNEGLKTYWKSVDAAIRFWCIALSKKFEKKPTKSNATNKVENTPETARNSKSSASPKSNFKKIPVIRNHDRDNYRNYSHRRDNTSYRYIGEYEEFDRNSSFDYNKESRYKWRRNDYKKTSRRLPY